MAAKTPRHNPVPVSDLVSGVLDPVLAKRAGISTSLLQAWDEIVGDRLAELSRPEQIKWNRRASEEDPFEPATLTVACEAMAALHIQHETTEIIARINAFLGYSAIGRIKIVQKPVQQEKMSKPELRTVSDEEKRQIADRVSGIKDDELRKSLERLGKKVAASR